MTFAIETRVTRPSRPFSARPNTHTLNPFSLHLAFLKILRRYATESGLNAFCEMLSLSIYPDDNIVLSKVPNNTLNPVGDGC